MSDSAICPFCGAPAVEIVYGYPSPDLFDEAERGDVVLGGCIVDDSNPTHCCTGTRSHNFKMD